MPAVPRAGVALGGTTSGGSVNGILAADGQNGLWVPSSEGLSYFDRRTERFTHRFQHDDANPHSLDSNAIFAVYQDRGGVLWVGTEGRDSTSSTSGGNSSDITRTGRPIPAVSRPAG